jgi:hypothetical protein
MQRNVYAGRAACEGAMRQRGALICVYKKDRGADLPLPPVMLVFPSSGLGGERVHANTLKAMLASGAIEVLSSGGPITLYQLKRKEAASS